MAVFGLRDLFAPWLIVAALTTLMIFATAAFATGSVESWQPPPPVPDAFDWVQLTSGEWLKGQIVAMYEQKLEFDSDKLGVLSLKWKDVKELRSAGTMEVAFDDGRVLAGTILVDEETIRVIDGEDRRLPRSEILSITASSPRGIGNWAIKASLGLNARRGNSEQAEATTRVVLIRRSARNRVNLEYLASFNQIEGSTTADNQRATTGWNRYISRRLYWTPLFGEWFRDPFQNISTRWNAGAGLGYELVDTARISWEVEGGFSYQETRFDSVAEGESATASTPAVIVATKYDHELTGWLDYSFEWRASFINEESGTYTHHLVTGLELELTKRLDLDITLIWDRTQNPQADAEGLVPEQDDYRLVTSLGFEF
jgi:putative salt-induced outer membrane protein YdiY